MLISGCSTTYRADNKRLPDTQDESICKDIPQESGLNPLDPEDIRIISWNIYKGEKPGWQDDLYRLSDNQSVVILQEASLESIEHTLENDPHTTDWLWQFAPGYIASGIQTGVMNFTRSPARYSCHLSHKEPWLRSPKASLVTRYAIENTSAELLVANIHGINFTLGISAYRKQISDLARNIAKHTGPVIVAGDFNSWSEKRNLVLAEIFDELKLQKIEFDSTYRKVFFGHPLDHIFFRDLEVKSKAVHQLDSSDHNPIQVNFQLITAE